jgi:toxoflavin biosynthesis protein ToxD
MTQAEPVEKIMRQQLTGTMFAQLQKALLEAFPSKADLAYMLRVYMDLNLDAVAGGNNQSEIVFNLIQKAEAGGWVGKLIEKAREANPGSEALHAFAEALFSGSGPGGCSPDRIRLECARIGKKMLAARPVKELRNALYEAQALLEECPKHRPEIQPLIDEIKKAIEAETAKVLAELRDEMLPSRSIKELRSALRKVEALVDELPDYSDTVLEARRIQGEFKAVIRRVWLRRLLLLSVLILVVLALLYLLPPGCNGPPPARPEMILIPAGTFKMGTSQEEIQSLLADYPDWNESMFNSETSGEVFLPEFGISKFEVTNEEYRDFLKENPGYRNIQSLGSPNQPVVNVSWDDAVAYCEWLTKITEDQYRLPTEAEWEKAARGSEGRQFPWGDGRPSNQSAIFGNTRIDSVGSKRMDSSPYGIMDMAGNVAEWCSGNGYDGDQTKAVRGGSWRDTAFYLRCAARGAYRSGARRDDLGFRVALGPTKTVH